MLKKQNNLKDEIIIGFFIIAITLLEYWIVTPTFYFSPNVFIGCVVLLSILLYDISVFGLFIIIETILLKFSPFLSSELFLILAIAFSFYFLVKNIFFNRNIISAIILIIISEILFWVVISGPSSIVTWPFIFEFLLTIIWVTIIFEITIWLKKKFL